MSIYFYAGKAMRCTDAVLLDAKKTRRSDTADKVKITKRGDTESLR